MELYSGGRISATYLAVLTECRSVLDRQTDGLTHLLDERMYILLANSNNRNISNVQMHWQLGYRRRTHQS